MWRALLAVAAVSMGMAMPGAVAQEASTTIVVDPQVALGATNPHLTGLGWNTGPGLEAIIPLQPSTIRIDGSLQGLSTGPDSLDVAPLLAKQAEIRRVGAEPQVILSYMPRWLGEPNAAGRDPTRVAPSDFDAWERLVENVVEAAATSQSPAYRFEVWNEPDLPIFWQDTPAAFLETAVRTHRAVQTVAERTGLPLEIGGPATVFPHPPFIAAYIARIRDAGLPLDYVSWHYYGNYPFLGPDGAEGTIPEPLLPVYPLVGQENPATTPQLFSAGVEVVRATVNEAIAGSDLDPELVLDEWNLSAGGLDERHDTHVGAAFGVGVLIELERAGLHRADFYRALSDGQDGDWGLVAADGRRKPAWWGFWAWRSTAGQQIGIQGDDPSGGLWARATSAGEQTHVLLVNWVATGGEPRNVSLVIAQACAAEVSSLDSSSEDLASFTSVETADGYVELQLQPQSVTWVRASSRCASGQGQDGDGPAPGRVESTPATGGGAVPAALLLLAAASGLTVRRHRPACRCEVRRGPEATRGSGEPACR